MELNDSYPPIDQFDWRYAESPDIPEPVYIGATFYMIVIGIFGTFSNGGVLLAFCRGSSEVSKNSRLQCFYCYVPHTPLLYKNINKAVTYEKMYKICIHNKDILLFFCANML